jgi:DNA-binding NarL/FixJ family response regulator
MSEDNELRYVVGAIYDAALNPMLWPEALARVAEFVGGPSRALSPEDLVSRFFGSDDHAGLDSDDMQLDAETCAGFDPLAALPMFDAGQIVDFPEFCDVATAVVAKPNKGCALRGVVPSEANDISDNDIGDAEMHRRMTLVAPHARRAILIGKAIGRKADEAAIFADILDSLSAGFFLIDAAGRIVHANAAGREILDADDFLRSIDGRLVVRDKKVNQTLQRSFADKHDRETDGEIGRKGIAIPLVARDGEYYIAHVLPLGARACAEAPGAATAMYVSKATLEAPSSAEVIRHAYQLTRTELRVLLAIVNVGGIREVATALGIADCTVKTHVRRLLEKTGAGRQTDLIKLVAGFFTPLVA